MSHTANNRIRQVHQELRDIVGDSGMAARLPQALLDRLKVMQGMLLEEMKTNPEMESHGKLLPAARPQDANAEHRSSAKTVQ